MRPLISATLVFGLLFASARSQDNLTIQDIFGSSKYSSRSFSGVRWIEEGNALSYQEFDSIKKAMQIWKYSLVNNARNIMVDVAQLSFDTSKAKSKYSSYLWSPDEQQILFASAPPEKQYLSRLTPAGNFYLYNLKKKSLKQLTNASVAQFNQKFSPDGKQLGFVRENNIYCLDIEQGSEMQLTTDGTNHIINGKFDWVYEEEFGISDGWMWSPDGDRIAFWQLDERRVPEYHLVNFLTKRSEIETMRYPKAGDPNSIVRIGVVSLKSKQIVWMDIGSEDDIYIPRMQWFPDGKRLLIHRLNRLQNKLELLEANVESGTSSVVMTETSNSWIDEGYEATLISGGEQLVRISDRDGYAHLYRLDLKSKKSVQITAGEWEVQSIAGIDEKSQTIYFTGSVKTPTEQHLYSVKLDGSGLKQMTADGFSHRLNLAPNYKYVLDTYSNTNTPPKVSVASIDGKKNIIIQENRNSSIDRLQLKPDDLFQFTTSDGVVLQASIIKPPSFVSTKKYPLLIEVYGGPNSQNVTNSWGGSTHLWHHMMAQKGYIIVKVDGRGTGRRGKEFRSIVYRNLGKWEVHDQCEVVRYLASQSFIDTSRVGIWGWSYGGYMAVSAILRTPLVFKTAVSVAPVTDWGLYDDIYTERYMGLPAGNPEGYKESSTLTYANQLQGNLLLLHGTTDDNVHWQNTVQLVDALQKAGKHFETQFYVNKNHSIYGGNTRVHLFETITNYLLDKL